LGRQAHASRAGVPHAPHKWPRRYRRDSGYALLRPHAWRARVPTI